MLNQFEAHLVALKRTDHEQFSATLTTGRKEKFSVKSLENCSCIPFSDVNQSLKDGGSKTFSVLNSFKSLPNGQKAKGTIKRM
jgi:hypothetical protein